MTYENIVLDSGDQIDTRTSHEIAAAQMRGEARVPGKDSGQVVRAIAAELKGLGLRPNLRELARRYGMGDPGASALLREAGPGRG